MNNVENYLISKKDFKDYFKDKTIINKKDYTNYLKEKSCQTGCQIKNKIDTI